MAAKITQKEIAEKADVSQCTVSRVLTGTYDNNVRRETAERILSLAGKMHYRKRFVPVRNNGHSTKNIGYLIPDLQVESFVDDPYYARFISGLTNSSEKNNCHITMYNRYSHLIQAILDSVIDGLIIEACITDKEVEFLKNRVPAVLLNRKAEGVSVDSVMPDNVGGIKKAVFYLHSKGHQNISFFGTKPLDLHIRERLKGYLEGMEDCGLAVPPGYVRMPAVKKGGVEEIEAFSKEAIQYWMRMKNRPTATVIVGDTYALPFLKTAGRMNIKLPEELSVISFDNRVSCIYSNPSLTSINQPMEEMAKKALILLSERMQNPDKPIENVVFDVELVLRESVCENMEKTWQAGTSPSRRLQAPVTGR